MLKDVGDMVELTLKKIKNKFKNDDIFVDFETDFSVKIISEMLDKFLEIVRWCKPIISSKVYAKSCGFSHNDAYG